MNFLNLSFYNGITRFVITIPCLGWAIKIAKINPLQAIKTVIWNAETAIQGGDAGEFGRLMGYTDAVWHSVRWQFRGIYCNLREHRFYKKSRNPFLWPTIFSFFGLINIQPLAKRQPEETADFKLWRFVLKVSENQAWEDNHTFCEEDNYAIDEQGHLRILDYGSIRSQKMISVYGPALYAQSRQLF